MNKQVEMAPDLDEKDDQILDSIWDNMNSSGPEEKQKSKGNKKETLKKSLEVLQNLIDDLGSDD